MTYEVTQDQQIRAVVATLPTPALPLLQEVFLLLSPEPWSGDPYVAASPDVPVRTVPFGHGGLVTYLVVDHLRQVDILEVTWLG